MRAVLITIADAANRDGDHARPGVSAMVEGSLYGKSHVSRVLRSLVAEGWLEVTEQGNGRGLATTYRVVMDRPETSPPRGGSTEETSPPRGGLEPGNLPISTPKPPHFDAETSPFGTSVPLSSTVKNNGKEQRSDVSVGTPVVAPSPFVIFWQVYPRHAAKAAARVAWDRFVLKAKIDPATVIAGARRYRHDPNRDPTFTPYPQKWLKEGRWEDDPLPPRDVRRKTNLELALDEQHAIYDRILDPGGRQ